MQFVWFVLLLLILGIMRTAPQKPQAAKQPILSQCFHLMMRHIMYVHYMVAMILSIHTSYYNRKIALIMAVFNCILYIKSQVFIVRKLH